jgi:membrane protein required for colicin V production
MDFALILDIIVIIILLISCGVAFLRGFVREVLTILGLVGAALVAFTAGPVLAPGMESWLSSGVPADELEDARLWGVIPYDIAASAFTYAGLFLVTLIILSILSHYIAKSVHAIGLGPVDRSLGVVFGIVRALVLIGLLYMPFHILMADEDKEDWFGTSNTITYVESTSDFLIGFMPESWERKTEESEEENSLDPLKDLTGEEETAKPVGTDEEAAEKQGNNDAGYDDLQRQAIDLLIENQDRVQDFIRDNEPQNNGGQGNE